MTTDVIGSAGLDDLLQESVTYARKSVFRVTAQELSHPTPCQQWDLRALLNHLNDSLQALFAARTTGRVGLESVSPPGGTDDAPLAAFDKYSTLLRRHGPVCGARRGVLVGDLPLAEDLLVAAGAIEMSVHGWDVGQAVGRPDSLPERLARELLAIAPLVVAGTSRSPHFGPVVAVPPTSGSATQLLAYLGRQEAHPLPPT